MKNKIIISFLFFSFITNAQEYKLFAVGSENKMLLKWMSEKQGNTNSFDVYRKENNGTWQKINEKPILAAPIIKESELKTVKNLYANDESYAFYIKYKNTKEETQNKQDFADYSIAISAIYDNNLAKHLGIFFEDVTINKSKKYDYKLTFSNSQTELSSVSGISVNDIPNEPKEAKASQEKQNITLTWKGDENFIGFNVYKDGKKANDQPIMPNLETGKNNLVQSVQENVKPGTYRFVVKGITFLNTESKSSEEISVTVKDVTPPIGITKLTGTRKENEVVLQWKATTDKEAKGYFVFKSTDKGKTVKKLNEVLLSADKEQFSETIKPEESGTFQYYIATQDQEGNTANSIPLRIFIPDHQAPEMPKSVISKVEPGKITLSWLGSTEKDLLGYRIYRGLKDDDENSMLLLNSAPQITTTFSEIFLSKAATKFIYKITAIDKSFNESKKATLWVQLPDIIPPSAPFLKEAIVRENAIELQWNWAKEDAIQGYNVYKINDEKLQKLNENLVLTANFSDKSVFNKGVSEYYIQAVDSSKLISKPSNRIFVNGPELNRNAAVKLTANQDTRSRKVTLTIEGITPAEVQSMRIYRKDGPAGFRVLPIEFNKQSLQDETSASGKIYQYYFECVDFSNQKIKSAIINFNNP